MTTLTQTPQTAQRIQLSPSQLQLVAKVATRDLCHNQTIAASDIRAVTLRDGMVDIYFNEGGKTIVPVAQFKEWIAEYKAQEQLSEEQQEIIEAAIDSPFQSEVNFQETVASFYSDEDGFVGTVKRDVLEGIQVSVRVWLATTENTATVHKTASDAVQSLTTCTYEEWENAKFGLEGHRYLGQGFWRYGNGRTNTRNLLDILKLTKTDREIAIVEQKIMIAD